MVKMTTAKKCIKMSNARAGRAELLFFLIKTIVMWRLTSSRVIFIELCRRVRVKFPTLTLRHNYMKITQRIAVPCCAAFS